MKSQGMAGGTLFPIRGYERDFPYRGKAPGQRMQSGGTDAIVIGDQDLGRLKAHI